MAKNKSKTCLVCDGSTQSLRNTFSIFIQPVSTSDKKIVEILSTVLNTDLKENSVHSVVICKKCYKVCNDIDEIQERLEELKKDIVASYEKTLRKQNECILEFDEGDEDDLKSKDDNEIFEPKKPVVSKKKAKASTQPTPAKPVSPVKTQSRTVVTVKMVDLNDPEVKPQLSDGLEGEDKTTDEYITTNEVDDDSDFDLDDNDDRVEEIMEADLKEGEFPLKLEVKKEQLTSKRTRGRPRKKPKEEEIEMTPQMVIIKGEDNTYNCLLCESLENRDAKDIISHVRTVHDIKLYICDMCGKEFMKRSELHIHLDEHMSMQEEGEFQCEVCNRIFNSLRLYRVHKKLHFQQPKNYFCDLCGKRFSSRSIMEDHLVSHTGARPYECKTCKKTFVSKYTYKAHLVTHTDRKRPFSCEKCDKSFYTQQNLVQHEKTHSGSKDFVCTECGKAFGTLRNLEVHLAVHTGNRPFICRVCGKSFVRKAEVKDHERTHTGEKPYQCEFCGAQFSQRSNLQSHKRATHFNDKRYPCTSCPKAFKRRRLLDYHIKAAHTGERPYQCDICNATFIYPEHFKKHRRIHTGEKPYVCEVCGKAFNSRDNRNAHRFVHSDKKPYECVVCGAGFMRKPLLYAHMAYQNHETETIVINQPQLSAQGELESFPVSDSEDNVKMTLVQDEDGNTKLVPLEFSNTNEDESQDSNLSVEHLIINDNGQVVELKSELNVDAADIREISELGNSNDGVVTLEDVNMVQDSTILETDDGPVHLLQIRLPDEKGELRETWVNIIPSE
ncbi:hypothetical protein M8J76_015387 [Diaphorina citri]|nr:hypothetical protein M8J76_015387 [Diaphorina citri]KAI5742278.1 hypothetical protein M8J77_005564 [Diaphorina citri]